jgi:uncharacterized damage-inducible protein DinB
MRLSSRCFSLLGCCLLAATSTAVLAQEMDPKGPAIGTHVSPSAPYEKLLSVMGEQFVSAAEAMPADKYNFAPPASAGEFTGVRTFAGEVRHVAETNFYFFHDPAAPLVDNRAEIEKLTSKDDLVKALKESFAAAHKYVAGMTDQNAFEMTKSGTRAGQATLGLAHFMDHYGQMCIYLRMNGIVPPASRK